MIRWPLLHTSIIAPAFIVPNPKLDTRVQWGTYDGSLDGVFEDVTTYGGSPGTWTTIGACFYDPALNRGLVHEGGNSGNIEMFQISSPLVSERLGDRISHPQLWNGKGAFTATDSRIWLPHVQTSDNPSSMRVKFAEYDGSGLTVLQGTITNAFVVSNNSNHRSLISEIDSTRALWSFQEPALGGGYGMRVGILQRSGGTLLTTVNSVVFGVGVGVGLTNMEGARPLSSTRSLVVFPTNAAAPFTFDVQGVAHAGTTPTATGSASTVTTNARIGPSNAVFGRLSPCLDGFAPAKGRFIFAWVDNTNNDLQLRCIQYDGTTITQGSVLDTGIAVSAGESFDLEPLGDGIVVFIDNADPTAAGNGFRLIEYNPEDADDLDLAMSALGQQQVAKDGFLTGHTATGAFAFPISRNRFGIGVHNSFDESINIKIVHNGGDSVL